MDRLLLAPGPPLSRFVEQIWYYQNDPQPHSKERLMPDGCMSLVINLADNQTRFYDPDDTSKLTTYGPVTLTGPRTSSIAIDTDEQACVVGISFRPAGALPFLKMPCAELHNHIVNVDDLWGRLASELRVRILEAATPAKKLHAVELILLQRAAGNFKEHPVVEDAIQQFLRAPQAARIAEFTHKSGLTSRRFIDLFKYHVGLAPKLFCRVRRFQDVLRSISAGRPVVWSNVALDCGYFDQSHFIRDFRSFAGLNPSKYLSDHSAFSGHHNHLPIL